MRREPGSPAEWLRYARSDLALARKYGLDDVLLETLCFHAQQSAEKSIKSVLVKEGVPFPRVHSIERLIDLLPPSIPATPNLMAAARLTAYGTTFRYPGIEEPISQEQYHEALRLAEEVFAWAENIIGSE